MAIYDPVGTALEKIDGLLVGRGQFGRAIAPDAESDARPAWYRDALAGLALFLRVEVPVYVDATFAADPTNPDGELAATILVLTGRLRIRCEVARADVGGGVDIVTRAESLAGLVSIDVSTEADDGVPESRPGLQRAVCSFADGQVMDLPLTPEAADDLAAYLDALVEHL